MWLHRTCSFCCPGSPTDVSLPGWQPVPSALGWMSAMHATAACGHSGVVLLGRCCTSLDCCLFAPTVLATSRYGLLLAYTGEAGRLKRNCFESVGDSSRAGGDGGCVAGLSVVWCARSGSNGGLAGPVYMSTRRARFARIRNRTGPSVNTAHSSIHTAAPSRRVLFAPIANTSWCGLSVPDEPDAVDAVCTRATRRVSFANGSHVG